VNAAHGPVLCRGGFGAALWVVLGRRSFSHRMPSSRTGWAGCGLGLFRRRPRPLFPPRCAAPTTLRWAGFRPARMWCGLGCLKGRAPHVAAHYQPKWPESRSAARSPSSAGRRQARLLVRLVLSRFVPAVALLPCIVVRHISPLPRRR
jgi:hypothetical protein